MFGMLSPADETLEAPLISLVFANCAWWEILLGSRDAAVFSTHSFYQQNIPAVRRSTWVPGWIGPQGFLLQFSRSFLKLLSPVELIGGGKGTPFRNLPQRRRSVALPGENRSNESLRNAAS